MTSLKKAIVFLENNPRLRAKVECLNAKEKRQTPPDTIRAIIDAIASKRNVTLYKDN